MSHTGSQQPTRQIPLLPLGRRSRSCTREAGLGLHRSCAQGRRWRTPLPVGLTQGAARGGRAAGEGSPPRPPPAPWLRGPGWDRASPRQLSGRGATAYLAHPGGDRGQSWQRGVGDQRGQCKGRTGGTPTHHLQTASPSGAPSGLGLPATPRRGGPATQKRADS